MKGPLARAKGSTTSRAAKCATRTPQAATAATRRSTSIGGREAAESAGARTSPLPDVEIDFKPLSDEERQATLVKKL